MATWSDDGRKEYAEYGPDGEYHGRNLSRWPEGHIGDTGYYLFERGKQKEYVVVFTPASSCTTTSNARRTIRGCLR